MQRRRLLPTLVAVLVLLLVMAAPSHGVTGWLTRSDTTGKGAGELTTMTGNMLSLAKPHAIRVGVATPKGISKRVMLDWMVECEKTGKDGYKRVTTKTDGSLTWITQYDGTKDLGRACLVFVGGGMNNTTQLRTVVQYKSQ